MENQKKKSFPGIVVLAVFAFLWGISTWLAGLDNSTGRLMDPGEAKPWINYFLVSDNFIINCRFYALTSIPFLVGIGTLMRKNWGRIIYILSATVEISFALLFSFRDLPTLGKDQTYMYLGFLVFNTVFYSIPIWYLNRTEVKEQFIVKRDNL